MGGVDVHSNDSAIGSGVKLCPDGAKGFGKDDVSSTMQQSNRLCISFNGHSPDKSLR
jgi:hypothetical protein